jgi:3-mercaptopyruvate sulfurtransferase SseA
VALLDGGLEKWSKEHGGDTDYSPGNIAPAVLTVHPHPALVIEMPAVKRSGFQEKASL